MTVAPAPAAPPAVTAVDIRRRQRITLGDDGFRWLSILAGLSVLVILALILVSTGTEAWPVFREEGARFLFADAWRPNEGSFGALPLVFGTLVSSAIALVIAVPVSIGIGLFLTEVAPARLRAPVTTLVDLLAAIPSVVYGLWGILVLAPWLDGAYERVEGAVDGIPVLGTLFSGSQGGRGLFTAGLVLTLMVTPVVTSVSREVLATVAPGQKEAAYGLGATRWEMIRTSMLPISLGGLTAAAMLGLGRAVGETIAAALVIGSSAQITAHLFAPGDSMAAVVANQFGEASGTFRAALIGLGVLLFLITVVVNTIARAIVRWAMARSAGVQ